MLRSSDRKDRCREIQPAGCERDFGFAGYGGMTSATGLPKRVIRIAFARPSDLFQHAKAFGLELRDGYFLHIEDRTMVNALESDSRVQSHGCSQ